MDGLRDEDTEMRKGFEGKDGFIASSCVSSYFYSIRVTPRSDKKR